MKKPRTRKVPKPPGSKNPAMGSSKTGVPWGRAASEHRPGLFIKRYLQEHSEACAADIFHFLKQELKAINQERVEIGDRPIRGCTYNSFAKYFHWFKLLGLVEPIDGTEPAVYDFLEQRQFYRLTAMGEAEEAAWRDPVRAAHPEFG